MLKTKKLKFDKFILINKNCKFCKSLVFIAMRLSFLLQLFFGKYDNAFLVLLALF